MPESVKKRFAKNYVHINLGRDGRTGEYKQTSAITESLLMPTRLPVLYY